MRLYKKLLIICIVLILIIFSIDVGYIWVNREAVGELIFQKVSESLEPKKLENYGYVTFYDYQIGDGKFLIEDYTYGRSLTVWNSDLEIYDRILNNCRDYKDKKDKFYITADKGYALIYVDENICKIYPTISMEELETIHYENGETSYYPTIVERDDVEYVRSFEDFTEEEQKIFTKLINKRSTTW